eukprot:CAMPEP_0198489790 /NCGR_PEP_ID=MMETSP1462-20131121/1728_1 /TAXON_ID=1333877 /ORGANISM="Brandtodinium nutriculum, Strain RCC3387" /LENGTH=57 /DNA_ID=CAMNT_0044218311 /DNA_START=74 /DNA_END=244 /DNA_ORIENTATION=-
MASRLGSFSHQSGRRGAVEEQRGAPTPQLLHRAQPRSTALCQGAPEVKAQRALDDEA